MPSDLHSRLMEPTGVHNYVEIPTLASWAGDVVKANQRLAMFRSNEATKAIERSIATLVLIGADVEPAEIVMHLGPLCDEKKIPYLYINKQNDLGAASGLDVGSAAAAIVKPGKAKEIIDDIIKQVTDLRA